MAVRKICRQKGCRASPRCGHPWWFDLMHNRKRWRMPVDEFAIARGATEPITSKETAMKVWEPKFLAEIIAGRDPHFPPEVSKAAVGVTVADFLDLYYANYVEAEGLRDPVTVRGRLKAVKAVLIFRSPRWRHLATSFDSRLHIGKAAKSPPSTVR